MKIIKVGSCWECADKDICGAYDRCDNTRDLLRNKTILPDCPLQSSDDWFKEELNRKLRSINIDDTLPVNRVLLTSTFVDWLKSELLKPR